jgi:inosine triphosphate pyrophosphatase
MGRRYLVAKVTFITGNKNKLAYATKFLDYPFDHKGLELDEIQSLDLREVAEHKVKQAYEVIRKPVLVEDISLSFNALGGLPGPFIKWFLREIGNKGMCALLDGYDDRSAVARVCFAYYDGANLKLFEGKVAGRISNKPKGNEEFGWNCIFIPNGSSKTYGEMDGEETEKYSLRTTTVYPQIKEFLQSIDKIG